ncbi:MAG: hypothetical protein FWD50_01490 [Betaproteobacteria bacterium]|nr:hypothetical protein [Betaproteobacteria bacterium]
MITLFSSHDDLHAKELQTCIEALGRRCIMIFTSREELRETTFTFSLNDKKHQTPSLTNFCVCNVTDGGGKTKAPGGFQDQVSDRADEKVSIISQGSTSINLSDISVAYVLQPIFPLFSSTEEFFVLLRTEN